MRNAIIAGLVLTGWFTKDPTPADKPPDPPPHFLQASPSPSPTVGPLRLLTPPYDPLAIQQAAKKLAQFKGIPLDQYRERPADLIADTKDVARFFAYLSVLAQAEGQTQAAILYYCYAIKADPRFLTLVEVAADPDPDFFRALSLIQLEAVKFLVEQVTPAGFNVQPSRLQPHHQKKA